jgi:hypothetical protein
MLDSHYFFIVKFIVSSMFHTPSNLSKLASTLPLSFSFSSSDRVVVPFILGSKNAF